jgi:hypothetical protein
VRLGNIKHPAKRHRLGNGELDRGARALGDIGGPAIVRVGEHALHATQSARISRIIDVVRRGLAREVLWRTHERRADRDPIELQRHHWRCRRIGSTARLVDAEQLRTTRSRHGDQEAGNPRHRRRA